MGNSIRTTSSTQTTTNSAPATFKAGDSVLCPSLGLNQHTFTLTADSNSKSKLLAIQCHDRYFKFDADGFRVSANECETAEYAPSLFHDTLANRAATAALHSTSATSRTFIDFTDNHDDEIVLISSCMLSDTACEVLGAAEVMHDIGQLLYLIYNEKIPSNQVQSMARLVSDTTDRWHSILYRLLDTLNEPLEQTKFGKVEG